MNHSCCKRLLTAVGLCLLAPSAGRAAAPTLTYLFPAGAQRGQTVEVSAGGTFDHWPVQAWVESKGIEVKAGKEKGKLLVSIPADALPGTTWIRLHDQEGVSAPRPFLVGTLPELTEQEPNDDFKKPHGVAAAAVTVNGRLEKIGDVDCFAVRLRKGQTLVAALEANRTLGSPMDGVLQVLSADGFVLEQNNDFHGLDPQVALAVPRDGTYIVRIFAFPAVADSGIRFAGGELFVYRLTLTTEGFADHALPLAVARAEPGQVELIGWNIPDTAKKLPVNPTAGVDSATVFHPQLANAVQVRLEPHPAINRSSGNDPQSIALPVTVTGRLERPGVVHAYQFEAKKGQRLHFQVEARALGFPLDAVLRVLDSAGKAVAQSANTALGRDPELTFVAAQDGSYRLEVRDLHADGGPRHLYRLRAVSAAPDFELALAAERFMLVPGKPLDIPVTVDRRHGFNQELEITVEGLPAGVTAAVGPVTAKSITLRLTAEIAPTSLPIRIIGKAKGTQEPVRTARAPITGLAASTSHVWLTILRPGATPEKPKEKK